MKRKYALLALSLSLFAETTFAEKPNLNHLIVAPSCLYKQIAKKEPPLATTSSLVLFRADNQLVQQLANIRHKESCGRFMDVSHAWENDADHHKNATFFLKQYELSTHFLKPANFRIHHQKEVNQLLQKINPEIMWNNLTSLTHFQDRSASSDNGLAAANWLKEQVEKIAKDSGHNDVTVSFIETGGYKQPSVVAKFGEGKGPGIVIGGHMDTLASWWGPKPGADDDGSGSVTVLEAARVLLESGKEFKKPIYFIWYAAEEVGLVGSQYVVDEFKNKNIPVDAVIQFDMTGYAYQNDPTLWLISDNVNDELTAYLEKLITTYVKQPVKYTQCGYACSDHASWNQGGFRASMPFESSFGQDNPDIHTGRDTMDKLSLAHMTDYAKLAVAFAVELAESN